MTPKEKANELGNKFYQGSVFDYSKQRHLEEKKRAKKRALICVDEIVQVLWHNHEKNSEKMYRYYLEVKQELLKL